ncbi:MAG: methyltransferase [Miniphocaeibacter sp.]|uniref:tRNA1(Val) (adenine(37)-N6)-methyltransferase n=1 Tax=Miniphocaeibacter sp. TaxID=3100973 RepID=UPI003BB03D4F
MKLNYIPGTNYKIYTDSEKFSFGIDAILLSDFAKTKKNSRVLEIGGGTGIISLRMNYLYSPKNIACVEIQKDNFEILSENIKLNKLQDCINPINEDINNCYNLIKNDSLDVIVTNPPYYKLNHGIKNNDMNQFISRYEVYLTLEDIFKFAKLKLKSNGILYMINRPRRLVDILYYGRKYKMEPKKIVPVISRKTEEPKMILLKFVKNGRSDFVFEKPLIIYNDENEYTDRIKRIYYGQ